MATNTNVVNRDTTTTSLQAVPANSAPAHADSTAIIQVIERAALNPDVDIDKMERLLQMQECSGQVRADTFSSRSCQFDLPR